MRHSKSGSRTGFTLIELMIVIAIIAIIAAISIPGLLQSQRAANERNSSASLKTLATAEADFRANDRDGNHVTDFWTRDVAGLYGVFAPGGSSTSSIKLIELTVAMADAFSNGPIAGGAAIWGQAQNTTYGVVAPKAGYWYYVMTSDTSQSPVYPYQSNTDATGNYHCLNSFGFGCYPDSMTAGRLLFIINDACTIYRRPTIGNVRPLGPIPPGATPLAAGFNNAADNPNVWPTDANLAADYSKLD
jgi:prepilin-type N-terminal cleavage/methylation domain-containing protein